MSRGQLRYLDAVEVVYGQDGAPLVLVADEAEAFGLPSLLVSYQVDVDDLSVPDKWNKTVKCQRSNRSHGTLVESNSGGNVL